MIDLLIAKAPLFREYNLLNLKNLYLFKIASLMYRVFHGDLNNNVSFLFNKCGTMNICTTRVGPLSFRVPKHKLELSAVHPQE